MKLNQAAQTVSSERQQAPIGRPHRNVSLCSGQSIGPPLGPEAVNFCRRHIRRSRRRRPCGPTEGKKLIAPKESPTAGGQHHQAPKARPTQRAIFGTARVSVPWTRWKGGPIGAGFGHPDLATPKVPNSARQPGNHTDTSVQGSGYQRTCGFGSVAILVKCRLSRSAGFAGGAVDDWRGRTCCASTF